MRAFQIQQGELAAMLNYLMDSTEITAGVPPGTLGRYPIPQQAIHTGPSTVHNIHVDRSVVGAINTGSVQRLNVSLDRIKNAGQPEAAAVIQTLTEAVLGSRDLTSDAKGQSVDHLSYLAGQAALPEDQRERGVTRVVLEALRSTLSVAADVATVWGPASVLLGQIFSAH
jgi:hypothetical protein